MEKKMKTINLIDADCHAIELDFKANVKYTNLSSEYRVEKRRQSAFVYVEKGSIHYSYDDGEFESGDGVLIYVPQEGSYKYNIKNADFSQIEVEFYYGGEPAILSACPMMIKNADISEVRRVFKRLEEGTGIFEKKAAAYIFLEQFYGFCNRNSQVPSKITPAVEYLSSHCNEKLHMGDIAGLCFLSESQMRRLFREELGMSPIDFKNTKRMENARELLAYSDMTVSEIALSLGFENTYSFSTFFKKYAGVSPGKYRKQ